MSTTTRQPLPWHQRLARAGLGPIAGVLFMAALVLLIGAANALGDFVTGLVY